MWCAHNSYWVRRLRRMDSSVLCTSHVSASSRRITSTRSRWASAPTIVSTCSARSSGAGNVEIASASKNSPRLAKWWKKDPVVTPAFAAIFAVVAPAKTSARESSSMVARPASISRSRAAAGFAPGLVLVLGFSVAGALDRSGGLDWSGALGRVSSSAVGRCVGILTP